MTLKNWTVQELNEKYDMLTQKGHTKITFDDTIIINAIVEELNNRNNHNRKYIVIGIFFSIIYLFLNGNITISFTM